jgi:hypothetical protein
MFKTETEKEYWIIIQEQAGEIEQLKKEKCALEETLSEVVDERAIDENDIPMMRGTPHLAWWIEKLHERADSAEKLLYELDKKIE